MASQVGADPQKNLMSVQLFWEVTSCR